jgi:hypothetical protein
MAYAVATLAENPLIALKMGGEFSFSASEYKTHCWCDAKLGAGLSMISEGSRLVLFSIYDEQVDNSEIV